MVGERRMITRRDGEGVVLLEDKETYEENEAEDASSAIGKGFLLRGVLQGVQKHSNLLSGSLYLSCMPL